MARTGLRRFMETRLGAPGRALLAWRTRGRAEALLADRGLTLAAARIAERLSDHVARGPFAGMHYPRRRGDIVHTAKLLGAYECELHAALERLVARAPALVVNIGSGDGYYAVGLARQLPAAHVIAVDPDPLAQRACADTAGLNALGDRIRACTRVDADALERLLASVGTPALLVVDCEGYEDELLDHVRAPSLVQTDMLVETHDFARAGVTARLTARFASTHDVEEIGVAVRISGAFSELSSESPAVALGLLDEFRHRPQSWLVLTARDANR